MSRQKERDKQFAKNLEKQFTIVFLVLTMKCMEKLIKKTKAQNFT